MVIETSLWQDISLTNLYPFRSVSWLTKHLSGGPHGSSRMPWKCQESCIRTQCFTKNVLDIVSTRLCFIHELWERVGMNSPHTNSHPQSPHFRFEKQIETGQTWCFCTKKKIDWAEATAKAYKWRLWNTGFWLAESIWSQPMALALRFAANPFVKNFDKMVTPPPHRGFMKA